MRAFELDDLMTVRGGTAATYAEFLRVAELSAGVYVLPVGGVDPQKPHSEDEVYYVVRGMGQISVEEESRAVRAGSIVYVPAHATHHFYAIEEELTILVFFAPAEYTRGEGGETADC